MAMYGAMPMLPGGSLEEQLRARRSSQAGSLQASQASMGVPGQQPPGSGGPPPGGPPPGSRIGALMQERQGQEQQLQSRQQDLQVGERLLQLLDPRVPRPARQFLFRELSRQVGIDPSGQRAKDIGAMLTSLDPQALENARRALTSQITQAEPGQVTELTRGVLSGQVPITRLVSLTGDATSSGQGGSQASGAAPPSEGTVSGGGGSQTGGGAPFPGMMRLGAGGLPPSSAGAGGGQSPVILAQAGTPQGDQPPLRMPFQSPPESAPSPQVPPAPQVPPRMAEIVPELAEILGLDNTQRYRNIDVIRGGFTRIPTTEADQRRMATDIRSLQDGVISTLLTGGQLHALIAGRPEALNFSLGRLPWIGELTVPNPASVIMQTRGLWQGTMRALGIGEVNISPEAAERLGGLSSTIAQQIAAPLQAQLRVGGHDMSTEQIAALNARIQALVVNLAFSMAAAQGQTGRNLSDRDLELQMTALGRSSDPQQFQAAIQQTLERIYSQYRVRTGTQVGQEIPLNLILSPEVSRELASYGSTPRALLDLLRGPGGQGGPGTQAPPTAETPPTQGPLPPPGAGGHLTTYDAPDQGGASAPTPVPSDPMQSFQETLQFIQGIPRSDQFLDVAARFENGNWQFVGPDGSMFTVGPGSGQMDRLRQTLFPDSPANARLRIFMSGQGTPEGVATLPTGAQVISEDIWRGLRPPGQGDPSTLTPAQGASGSSVTPGSGSLMSMIDALRQVGGGQPQTGTSLPTAPTTAMEGVSLPFPQRMTGVIGPGTGQQAPMTPPVTPPTAPPAPLAPPTRRRLDRISPSIEDEETAARGRIAEDRAAQLAERARAVRAAQLAEEANDRANRAEQRQIEENRRQRIRDAFAQIAAAMRHSGSGGGISLGSGGGGGADQDPRAFQLAPAPQRRAPTPVNAAQFQPRR